MKKKIILIIAGITLLASLSVSLCSRRNVTLIDSNVEALADSESSLLGPMCSKTGVKGNYKMKLCSDCSGELGSYAMDVVAFCMN